MITNFTKWVLSIYEKDLETQEIEVIEYGLEQGIYSILGIITVLLIGGLLEILPESIIFLAALIPLRMYSGGYHASTRANCASISLVLMVVALGIIKYIKIEVMISLGLSFIEVGVLYYLIPVDGTEKLDDLEKLIYRKRGRMVLILEQFLFIFTVNFLNEVFIAVFSIVLFLVLCGKAKKPWSEKRV